MEKLEQKLVVTNYENFPEAGIEGSIYAAEDKRMFYSWNAEEERYIPYQTFEICQLKRAFEIIVGDGTF